MRPQCLDIGVVPHISTMHTILATAIAGVMDLTIRGTTLTTTRGMIGTGTTVTDHITIHGIALVHTIRTITTTTTMAMPIQTATVSTIAREALLEEVAPQRVVAIMYLATVV